jgi:hypothetical protein
MDESLFHELRYVLSQRERVQGSCADADAMILIVDDKIRRLIEWLADKSDELEGISG